ncbi:hypothetical protein PR002_g4944 [Phytophthora rubi]|uniref:Secreted protein n=1 Tax=Phytophthora rubi TaxID=129364 RepID=A0A6A3NHL4_9STRA|nr:hypothetical protein PR002_g4944 [Phytophthora rubi]
MVTNCNFTLVVAACLFAQWGQQRFLRLICGDFLKCRNGHVPSCRGSWFILFDWHWVSLLTSKIQLYSFKELKRFAVLCQRYKRFFPFASISGITSVPFRLSWNTKRVHVFHFYVENSFHGFLDLGLVCTDIDFKYIFQVIHHVSSTFRNNRTFYNITRILHYASTSSTF